MTCASTQKSFCNSHRRASVLAPVASCGRNPKSPGAATPTIHVSTDSSLSTSSSRDKKGNRPRFEAGRLYPLLRRQKPQIARDVEDGYQLPITPAQPSWRCPGTLLHSTKKAPPTLDARDRRLIVLFVPIFPPWKPDQIERLVGEGKGGSGGFGGACEDV